jgi:hypothetical protein
MHAAGRAGGAVAIAARIESVTRSPYDDRAVDVSGGARISGSANPPTGETFLVGIEIATSETSGRSAPARRLIPTSTSNSPRRRSRRICTLERFDVGMNNTHAPTLMMLRQVLGMRLVSVVTNTRSRRATSADVCRRSST